MIDISVVNAIKAFVEGENILDGVSFEINSGEHVALLGKNGAGKTTLFRAITGEIELDEGYIAIPPQKKLGLISQIPVYPPEYTAEDVLKAAHSRLYALQAEMERVSKLMESDHSPELLERYDYAASEFERLGGYVMESERNRVANGLMIPDYMRRQLFSTLSGGEKTRVNLARLILEDTDILLLDEPTNHLDMRAVEWLEEYLLKFKGTALIISHDRYFLDRSVTRSIELDNGKAEFYGGNYTYYVEEKQRRFDALLTRYEREQKEAKRLEESVRRLMQWGTLDKGSDALVKKAHAIETRIEKLTKTGKPTKDRRINARFSEREFKADEALVLKGVSKSYDGKSVFSDVFAELRGGERIALVGDNGAGKTTLIRIITGLEKQDAGFVRRGPSVKTAYLQQHVTFDRPYNTILDTMLEETKCPVQIARNRLAAFKFTGQDVFKCVGDLSGGEKSRLRLCILMHEDVNFLILDEPTNHLDIQSREWIEETVGDYEGTLLFVSHDRYFCDKYATMIWELENGVLTVYECGFTAYKELKSTAPQAVKRTPERKAPQTGTVPARNNKTREKQIAAAEREIEKYETRLGEIAKARDSYATDYVKLIELDAEESEIRPLLDALIEQWETLQSE